ncbi:serine hydroxymethyltransferase [candidate division WOR-3 bacterium]|nr:serine hydroxymethyltransferase [candidate division WOR-3 bacterium]
MYSEDLYKTDPEIFAAVQNETEREHGGLELIASENFVSEAVLAALGSVLTNKYAEGYPYKWDKDTGQLDYSKYGRYYGGCEFVDKAEALAIERAKKLFGADHVNVQPHSGTTANMTAYFALGEPGDVLLGLNLSHGGHLSHGHPINFSGRFFKVVQYEVDPNTEQINFDTLLKLAREVKPKMIVAGASAYPRTMHFDKFREVADEVGAYLVADIAHIAGLVAAGLHISPVPYSDIVTTTTHKTLRGPRGAIVMCKKEHAQTVDKVSFPGMQGGPLEHVIAAKAVCFKEAAGEEFKAYQKQTVANAKALGSELEKRGYRIVAGGTDTHLMLVDLRNKGVTGRKVERRLEQVGITCNRNTIPYDPEKPFVTSGIRLGTPALTTRGMKEPEMARVAELIDELITNIDDKDAYPAVKAKVAELCESYPLYPRRRAEYKQISSV